MVEHTNTAAGAEGGRRNGGDAMAEASRLSGHGQEVLSGWSGRSRFATDIYLSSVAFQWPEYLEPSAWTEHAPFAFWLIEVHRPRTLVELGTHNGYSYFAFCQAVHALGLDARCFAVDHWKGDEHAGFYGEEVFQRVQEYNRRHYAAFSQLVRSTFDEAVAYFSDSSIDLLHIDGRHFYDDVKHDFESWRSKLSDRAIVLFHDTNVRERDFGVYRLWDELQSEFPSFEFLHGHGLGVLGVGASLPGDLTAFFTAAVDPNKAAEVRRAYARLGTALKTDLETKGTQSRLAAELSEQRVRTGELEAKLAERDGRIESLSAELEVARGAVAEREERIAALSRTVAERDERIESLSAELEVARGAVAEREERIADLETQLAAVYASRSWRITAPLRAIRVNLHRMGNRAQIARALARVALTKGPRPAYRLFKERRLLYCSGAFDLDYYRSKYPDVAAARVDPALHYLLHGAAEGRDPNAIFDTDWYLEQNPDVAEAGVNPLVHYVRFGTAEGRNPGIFFEADENLEQNPCGDGAGVNPLRKCWRFWVSEKPGVMKPRSVKANASRSVKKEEQAASNAPISFDAISSPATSSLEAYTAQILKISGAFADANVDYVPKALTEFDAFRLPLTLVAFYLPQFHPIPENDEWWGKGFTEWTNVSKAVPEFVGHYQPHLPGELGFYDLRLVDVMRHQVDLAKLYGIGGFCFYYYWFGGRRLLERPVDQFLHAKDIDFPFCFCWANESWTRRWDGLDHHVLLAQEHSLESDLAFIDDIIPAMRDPRYIRHHGRPLLVVYRAALLREPAATAARWRERCRQAGVGEPYLVAAHSFDCNDPRSVGFDAAVEFPPNQFPAKALNDSFEIINPSFRGRIYSYEALQKWYLERPMPDYPLIRGVCPGWDNEARKPGAGTIFHGSSPARYEHWLKEVCTETALRVRSDPDQPPFVFVNAWNEWAEGAHLEPDRRFGYAYLQATRNVLEKLLTESKDPSCGRVLLVSHDACPHGAQYLALNLAQTCTQEFGLQVDIIVLAGGPLMGRFAECARVHDLTGVDPCGEVARTLARDLWAAGSRSAICNTTVSGAILPILKEAGFKVVSLIHELPKLMQSYGLEGCAETIAQHADKVIFAADAVAEGFAQFAAVEEHRRLIRPQGLYKINRLRRTAGGIEGARSALRKKYGLAPTTAIVLAVGYADFRKGVDLFVQAGVKILESQPDTAFIWLGEAAEPAWMAQAKSTARVAGVDDRFHFPGFDEATEVYYAGADVYALTSREDPYPSVVLEALDSGLPVVAFVGATGMGELIEEAGGVCVPSFDTDAFAAAVLRFLGDNLARSLTAERGFAIIDDRFSFRRYVHDLLHHAGLGLLRVSVILPNYNYARFLDQRIRSILAQTLPPYELIFLDDASRDDSVAVARRLLRECKIPTRLIVNETNSGSAWRQWLRGVEAARGDYVWIAEADDLSAPDFLAEVTAAFQDPQVVLSYCQSRQMNEDGAILCPDYLDYVADIDRERWAKPYIAEGREEIAQALYLKNTIPNVSAAVFRRDILHKTLVAHADEIMSFRYVGDWVTYIRLLENGSIAFSPRALNDHRRHISGVTIGNFNRRHYEEIVKVQEEVIERFSLGVDAKEIASSYAARLFRQFGLTPS